MSTTATPLAQIEAETKLHEEARLLLSERVGCYKAGLADLERSHLPGVRRAMAKVADIEARLRALVEQNPGSFVKPKTQVLHGTKVGFQAAKVKVEFDKPARVVERIKRLMPEQVELLIHTEEKPNKEALAKLPAADVRRLGCTVTGGGDEVVVRAVDGAVEKMVKALLKDASDEMAKGEGDEGDAS